MASGPPGHSARRALERFAAGSNGLAVAGPRAPAMLAAAVGVDLEVSLRRVGLERRGGAPGVAAVRERLAGRCDRHPGRARYRRTITDWNATGPQTSGRERDTGTRISKALEGAKPRGRPQVPDVCASLPSITRAHRTIAHETRTTKALDFHPSGGAHMRRMAAKGRRVGDRPRERQAADVWLGFRAPATPPRRLRPARSLTASAETRRASAPPRGAGASSDHRGSGKRR
jgi:hypothetical protein